MPPGFYQIHLLSRDVARRCQLWIEPEVSDRSEDGAMAMALVSNVELAYDPSFVADVPESDHGAGTRNRVCRVACLHRGQEQLASCGQVLPARIQLGEHQIRRLQALGCPVAHADEHDCTWCSRKPGGEVLPGLGEERRRMTAGRKIGAARGQMTVHRSSVAPQQTRPHGLTMRGQVAPTIEVDGVCRSDCTLRRVPAAPSDG